MLAVGTDGYAELSPVPPPDDWQVWNEQRDRIVVARGKSYGYLPDELRVYSSDFEENGRWVNVPEYGYVWTPTVVVTGNWAPYRDGRWVWRGGDYVWVGYEPWGWAPYHYGRWAFAANIGWVWVPPARGDVYWAPGYVGWVRSGDHVAWVPLAPRETYYGYGNHGRYSRNIRNVNVNQVRVTNVYRNANVTNSITVVNQTTFITGRPSSVDRNVVVNVREDFAKHRNIVVGRPPIKPVETSYIPVVRSIPEAKRPPAGVRKIDAKELRQSRPLVTEPNRSAFRPQGKPAPLEVRNVEKPRPASERAKERQQVLPQERRGPAPSQASPPGTVEQRVKPREAEPKAKGKPERPQPPPEKVKPDRSRRVARRDTVEPRVTPREAEPKATGKPERPQPPPEKVKPEPQPTGRPRGTVEPRGTPREAEPKPEAGAPATAAGEGKARTAADGAAAGNGGAARHAEGSGAEATEAGAPATAAGEGKARTAAEEWSAGNGGAARQAEGSGAESESEAGAGAHAKALPPGKRTSRWKRIIRGGTSGDRAAIGSNRSRPGRAVRRARGNFDG